MFDQSLIQKAMTDSQWRRDTALGRKVASKASVEDCYNLYRRDLKLDIWMEKNSI